MALKTSSEDQEVMSEINVTPLIDVMLVLLVVFLVTAPLLTQSVPVNLPRTAATVPNTDVKAVHVNVDGEGKVSLDERAVQDAAQLETEIRHELQRNSAASFQLNADQRVPYGAVAKVMAAAQRAGVAKLAFVMLEQ